MKTIVVKRPVMPGTSKKLKPGVATFGAKKWHWINREGKVCSSEFPPKSNVISEAAYNRMFKAKI